MSAGNIDDILARIQRLESATGSKPNAPADDGPQPPEPVQAEDEADILTPETYNEPEQDNGVGDAAEDIGDGTAAPAVDHAQQDQEDDDLFSSDESDGGPAMSTIAPPAPVDHTSATEPDSDEAPEHNVDAQADPDADIEFGLDRQSELDTGPDAATETEDAAEQEQEGPTEFDPSSAQAEQSAEACEPSFDGASPMADIAPPEDSPAQIDEDDLDSLTADAEDDAQPQSVNESVIESIDEASDDDEPTEPAVQGDGMISINPGGANASGMSDLFTPDSATLDTVKRSLADDLADAGISREQVAAAEKVAASTPGKDVAIVLIEQGVDEVAVQGALARHHGLPFERIDQTAGLDGAFDGGMLQRLGIPFCAEHKVLPLRMEGKRAIIASARPDIAFELDEIRRRLNCGTPKIVLTTEEDIMQALEIAGHGSEQQAEQEQVDLNSILEEVDENDVTVEKNEDQTVDLEQKAGESPVIRYVNYIIQTAVKEGASDIHIEPSEKKITVRLRIDGVLYESMNPPANMAAAITSRIKIMANLDISERRIPQDGRIRATVQGRKLDLRVSTLPCGYGEKVVMRILDTKSINVQLEDLGFDDNTLEIWKHQVKQPHGIVLVTGPTGSGKTTTLYSSLRQLDKNKLNISTAEDPIEYHLDGITQTQTHEKIGMTFSKVLKALLRQDPDVIMLGEIRDMETAHIAVQAALTGHLVLSTLHTNDAPSSVTRLVNIGLEPFLVGAAVNAVLAQRLVRRLCKHCKELRDPPPEQVEFLELSGIIGQQVYMPVGCEKCRQGGYSGRVGIYELLAVDDQLRDVIARNPNVSEFRRMCLERGMHSLRQDGMHKVAEGLTTVAEVLRVTSD